MFRIRVIVSGSLRQIYKDIGTELVVDLEKPTTVRELLCIMGINPIAVASVFVNGKCKSKDYLITKNDEIVLIGPLAGG
ncbi:MoaD/ThiS family protein [Desulfitibacter alkalitolerans]|uniref:MoaD/ThiS family protein n=1 Tax=Desulfitibacter alkalitolerans TaxID=264641 RepID=UPI00054D88A2|nr:MoaD/ThiS family protein [Desulfitibacter alkalitolerans]